MKTMKLVPLALILLAIALLVPSPALMEGDFFTLYGQFTAVAAAFAALLLRANRRRTLRVGSDSVAIDAINKVDTLTLALCCISAALIGARVLYCLFRLDFYLFDLGAAGMLRIWEGGFLLYGAALGAALAAVALAKARGASAWALLDEIAAPGMMAITLCRMAEGTTTEGVGAWLEGGFFCRFPFAVQNEWGEWQLAVYLFETVAALAILVYLTRLSAGTGEKFLAALLLYAGCQVVLESMRMDACLRIGFVRVSQVLSGVAALAVTLIRASRVGKKRMALSGALCLGCIAAAGVLEWALDKTPVSNVVLYAAMIAVCALMIANGMRDMKKEA